MDATTLEAQVAALDAGRGFVADAPVLVVLVRGADATRWLNDLVTAGVAGLAEGEGARSLLLSPTGRIRADVHVRRDAEGFRLFQDEAQPHPVDDLLARYVLSSDVRLERAAETPFLVPSRDGLVPADRPPEDGERVDAAAAEAWRIRAGVARFPVDLDEDSVPAEAGLERLVDTTKGCFLGQESVAKIRNLGHPPRVVLARRADEPVEPGTTVLADGAWTGVVTSSTAVGAGSALLARVRWADRDAALATTDGVALR